jgi:hypothetical protein
MANNFPRITRTSADSKKYIIASVGQLVFLFNRDGTFRNVWTLDNLNNTRPGTLDINER